MIKRHLSIWVYVMAVAVVFSWIGCTKKMDVKDTDIVANWGDTAVTVENFKAKMYVRFRNEPTAMKKTFEERISIISEYIERDIKLTEARRLEFDKREDIVKTKDEAIERKATELLYNDKVRNRLFTEDQIKDYFEHDKVEVTVQHILIKMAEDASGKDTIEYWKRINDVYEVAKSTKNFDRLVDKFSEDSSIDRSLHGKLEFIRWGKMVDSFQDAAWLLQPGELSKPIRTRYGYHIIKMVERRSKYLQVNTSHILVKCAKRADRAETTAAFDRAAMIVKEAQKSGANFAQLARRFSEDKNSWVNGEVGWIPRGSMPSEYWEEAFRLKPGEIGGPVKTYKGYHVIKAHEKRDDTPSLDDPKIRSKVLSSLARLRSDTVRIIAESYIDSLETIFGMKYNEEVVNLMLRKLNDKSAPSNMNRMNSFTLDERNMKVIDDELGGVSIEDLIQRYGENQFPPEYREERDFIDELVDPIAVPKYLAEVARRMGYFDHPDAIREGKRAEDNAMLPEIEREAVFNKAVPLEDEVNSEYENNIKKYTQAATVTYDEILHDDKQFSQDLYNRIVNDGEDISKLARRYTQRKKAKNNGGRMTNVTRDQYGAISRKVFALEEGDISGPIELNEANKTYAIVKLISKTPENVQSLSEVRKQIESDLRFKKQKQIKEDWLVELKKEYNLVMHEDVIRNVWPLVEQLPESMEKERKVWKNERRDIGKRAKAKRQEQGKIQMKLNPNSEQTFQRDGKDIKVKIGEPRYVKDGKPVDPKKSNIKISPQGKVTKNGKKGKASIELKPSTK